MSLRPLTAVGVALTVLGVALLLQADAGEARAGVGASAAPTPLVSSSSTPDATAGAATTRTPTPEPARRAAPAGPSRLAIPSIGRDHAMSGRGLSRDGTIDPPPATVMWFNGLDRVKPGSVGTAVIAAHVSTANKRDVFADLGDVDVGDSVHVVAADGTRARYIVTRASAIHKDRRIPPGHHHQRRRAGLPHGRAPGGQLRRHRGAPVALTGPGDLDRGDPGQ